MDFSLFEIIGKGFVYQNKDGEAEYSNDKVHQILGISRDELKGIRATDPRWHAIKEDGSPYPGEEHPISIALRERRVVKDVIHGVYHPKKEKYVWLKVDAAPFGEGAVAILEDITESKEKSDKDQEDSLIFHKIMENISDSVIILNEYGDIIDVNDETCNLLEYSKNEIIGLNVSDIAYDTSSEDFQSMWKDIPINESIIIETNHVTKNGTILPVEISAFSYMKDGEEYFLGLARDIRKRKQQEEETQLLAKELSHRVKNNLALINSLISLKESDTGCDLQDIRNYINSINIIHEKLYEGSLSDIKSTNIKKYLEDVLFHLFRNENVDLDLNIEDVIVETKSAVSLGLVVNELATNAMKHSLDGPEKIFSISFVEKEDNYYLSASNSGTVIPKDIKHTGLGFSIISSLIENMGGSFEIKREGRTTFEFVFEKF